MSGTYAHITIVNELKQPQNLELIADFPINAIPIVMKYFKYCELGAVSPDYPYLAITDNGAAEWADLMHYEKTGDVIHAGIRRLQTLSGEQQNKGLAWLMGYAAHVATDVTIHPVIELKVGKYADNKTDHRVCEMNQDTFIFKRLNLGNIGLSEHLDSGIGKCCSATDRAKLDPAIKSLWEAMLTDTYPTQYQNNKPNIDKWHHSFVSLIDNVAEEGNKLLPLARHVAVKQGLTYPLYSELDQQYITNLTVPGGTMHYDEIFNKAKVSVSQIWRSVANGVLNNSNEYLSFIQNWNLDTGRDENGRLAFWST